MAPQIVLITGCSSGIGLSTAVLLAKETQHEFKVYATMRNLGSKGNLETAAGDTLNKTLFIRELDVTKESTISSVVDEILRDNGRIDVVVNNAGYMGPDAIDQQSLEWCQAMMDTNYWGVVRTMRAVLPAMKKQKSGKILNVTSVCGIIGEQYYSTYSASKFAVEGFSESAARVLLDGFNIRVIIVEPGPVMTNLVTKETEGFEESSKDFEGEIREMYRSKMKSIMGRLNAMAQSPDDIAKLHLEIILDENPHLRYQTSELMRNVVTNHKLKDPTTDSLLKA